MKTSHEDLNEVVLQQDLNEESSPVLFLHEQGRVLVTRGFTRTFEVEVGPRRLRWRDKSAREISCLHQPPSERGLPPL